MPITSCRTNIASHKKCIDTKQLSTYVFEAVEIVCFNRDLLLLLTTSSKLPVLFRLKMAMFSLVSLTDFSWPWNPSLIGRKVVCKSKNKGKNRKWSMHNGLSCNSHKNVRNEWPQNCASTSGRLNFLLDSNLDFYDFCQFSSRLFCTNFQSDYRFFDQIFQGFTKKCYICTLS